MCEVDDNANMFAHVLPVYNPVFMSEHMPNVRFPEGIYNCGIAKEGEARHGIVRSCTLNQRHRLGRKAIMRKQYGSTLYFVRFNSEWVPEFYDEIVFNEHIHDVRLSGTVKRGIGCRRHHGGLKYTPVVVEYTPESGFSWKDLPLMPKMTGSQKNWIELPHDSEGAHIDVGHVEEYGQRCILTLSKQGKARLQTHPSRMTHNLKLRGGTNYVKTQGADLLVCYHVVDDLGDNVRDYKCVFALVEGCFPFYVKAMTPPLKLQSSSTENLVQFPMGLVRDGEKLMISYGLADADNVIAEISEQDLLNLMS